MKVTKELGDGSSVTVTFAKNVIQEDIDTIMQQFATGSFEINEGVPNEQQMKTMVENFKNHPKNYRLELVPA